MEIASSSLSSTEQLENNDGGGGKDLNVDEDKGIKGPSSFLEASQWGGGFGRAVLGGVSDHRPLAKFSFLVIVGSFVHWCTDHISLREFLGIGVFFEYGTMERPSIPSLSNK